MDLAQHANNLDARAARLLQALPGIVQRGGADLVALWSLRVATNKQNEEGAPFSPYSTKEVPAFFYLGRGRRSSTDAKLKALSKEKKGVSYRDFRELDGLDGSRKNFEFTGEMHRKVGVQGVETRGYVFTAVIGGLSEEARKKLVWNSAQEGRSILQVSRGEVEQVTRVMINAINTIR